MGTWQKRARGRYAYVEEGVGLSRVIGRAERDGPNARPWEWVYYGEPKASGNAGTLMDAKTYVEQAERADR